MTIRELLLNADLDKGVDLVRPDNTVGQPCGLIIHAADDCFTHVRGVGQKFGSYTLTVQDVLRTDWELAK